MAVKKIASPPAQTGPDGVTKVLRQYGCGPVEFVGTDNALYERHLVFDHIVVPVAASEREKFEAVARSVRDVLSQRWILTDETYRR